MPPRDSPDRQRGVLWVLMQDVWTDGHGWFPNAEAFRAKHHGEIASIRALVDAGILWECPGGSPEAALAWSVEALRMLLPDFAAQTELDLLANLVELLRPLYRGAVHREYGVVDLVSIGAGGIDASSAERLMMLLFRLGVTKGIHYDGTTHRPVKISLAFGILDLDMADLVKPRVSPPPSAPPAPVVPDNAIDGRWIPARARPRRGGNGEVLEVTDHLPEFKGRRLALKRLQSSVLSEKTLARFKREIQVVREIDHPNVTQILHASLDGPTIYFVTAFHERNLSEHVRNFKLSPRETLEMFAAICDGVQRAHRLGVVHRDIKPANILVDTKGRPVVADFGICYVPGEDRFTETEEQVGARKYMAPELRDGRHDDNITPSADVYSLGKLLYAMFAPNARMFDREDHRLERFDIVQVSRREELAHLNRLFDATIERDPAKRLPDAGAVAIAARDLVPVVAGDYRIPDAEGGQRCQFCGAGRYRPCPNEILMRSNGALAVLHLVCDACGHLQSFVAGQKELQKQRDAATATGHESPALALYRAEARVSRPKQR